MAAPVLAGEGGQQRRVLARVVGVRRARVHAVVGGEHEQVVVAQQAQPLADRGVDLAQRAVEALDVVAVAVDLVGLHEVGEDEAGVELAQQLADGRDAALVRGPRVVLVDAHAGEEVAHLAHGVDGHAGALQLVEVGAPRRRHGEVLAPLGAPEVRPASPSNGRAITRPTACSPVIVSRAAAHAASSSASLSTSWWAASCSTESADV